MGSTGNRSESYHQFVSEPASGIWSGHSFKGEGQDVINFFKDYTNNYDLIEEASQYESAVDAFNSWAVGDFMDGQQYDGFSNMEQEFQEKTRIYDYYLDRSVINKGFETRRLASAELLRGSGKTSITEEQLKKLVGTDIPARGNMSTSAASTGLDINFGQKPIEYVFQYPSGSRGAGMWIGDSRINDEWGSGQREFITNRDAVYTVAGYKYNKDRDVWEVKMKYKGRLPHDYS